MLAAMEQNVEECQGHLQANKESLERLAEVDEGDQLQISTTGELSRVTATHESPLIDLLPETPGLNLPPVVPNVFVQESNTTGSSSSADTVVSLGLGLQQSTIRTQAPTRVETLSSQAQQQTRATRSSPIAATFSVLQTATVLVPTHSRTEGLGNSETLQANEIRPAPGWHQVCHKD